MFKMSTTPAETHAFKRSLLIVVCGKSS